MPSVVTLSGSLALQTFDFGAIRDELSTDLNCFTDGSVQLKANCDTTPAAVNTAHATAITALDGISSQVVFNTPQLLVDQQQCICFELLGGAEACSPAYDFELCTFNSVSIGSTAADLLLDGSASLNFGDVRDQIS